MAPLSIRIKVALRKFYELDLRWSYYAIFGLILTGAIINIALPHGWTVWPFVLAAGIMLMIHEAADRNGTGVPPFHVYMLAGGGLLVWLILVAMLSVVNHFIVIAGVAGLGYYCVQAYLKIRKRMMVREGRRAAGMCIFCGHPINPEFAYCEICGQEPNPDAAVLGRIQAVQLTPADKARARSALKPGSPVALASSKEQALIARRRTARPSRK